MRISGTEPSSVILSQTMKFKKLKSDDPKVPKQAEAKRDEAKAEAKKHTIHFIDMSMQIICPKAGGRRNCLYRHN